MDVNYDKENVMQQCQYEYMWRMGPQAILDMFKAFYGLLFVGHSQVKSRHSSPAQKLWMFLKANKLTDHLPSTEISN